MYILSADILMKHLTFYHLISILSIDRICILREVTDIFLSMQSKRKEVIAFLEELKELLGKEDFDIDSDLTLIKRKKPDDEEHSTPYTLLDLDYDTWDVVERLKELTVAEYSETKIDKDDLEPPLLFVFGKNINRKLVYIKLKIKESKKRNVLCVSFHYARDPMTFPYS